MSKPIQNSARLWHERRYYSIDSYLKTTYGHKLYKIALDGGMTCPNRDGTLGSRGCIFCSSGGSGDFASSRHLSITQQIESGKGQSGAKFRPDCSLSNKTSACYIAYFQAYTNTYAEPAYLRRIFMEAVQHPDIAILSIATRPDCLDDNILSVLDEVRLYKPVWIELGLQTIHETSAIWMRRGYAYPVFEQAVQKLHEHDIPVIVHTILGLPCETISQMHETIHAVCDLPVFGLKLQMLHVLRETDLATDYVNQKFRLLSEDDYVHLIVDLLEEIPPSITIHRLTGDGAKELLLAPSWSLNKRHVLNQIQHLLKERNSWQGCRCHD